MLDVSVVEVSHECYGDGGEEEDVELVIVRTLLEIRQTVPDLPVDGQNHEEEQVRGGEVQHESLLVNGWK